MTKRTRANCAWSRLESARQCAEANESVLSCLRDFETFKRKDDSSLQMCVGCFDFQLFEMDNSEGGSTTDRSMR